MAKACVVCHKEGVQEGYLVEDDLVIRSIRAAKQKLGIAKNNVLVVEKGCLEAYRPKRAKYERDLAIHAAIGALVLLVFVLLPIFTTGFSIVSVLLGLLLFCLIMAFTVFSHCPKIAGEAAHEKAPPVQKAAKAAAGAKKARKK